MTPEILIVFDKAIAELSKPDSDLNTVLEAAARKLEFMGWSGAGYAVRLRSMKTND